MQGILYANITALELRGSLDGGEYAFPKVVAGSHLALKLRLSQDLEGEPEDVRRTVHAIKASLGRPDARPLGGGFQLKLGPGAESAGVNVTPPLAYNCTAPQLEAAINGLSGVPTLRPCKVQFAEGSFEIRFSDDSSPVEIVCVDNDLWPVSFVNASAVAFDEGFTHELRLVQSPVAQTVEFGLIVPDPPQVIRLQEGGENTGVTFNEIQKLTIPVEFRGAFQLSRGFRRTAPIGLPTDGDEVLEKLEALADVDGEFSVTEEQGALLIEFGGSMAGEEQELLVVTVFDPPPGDLLINLNTDKAEMYRLMRGVDRNGEVKVPLEITLTLEDEQFPDVLRPVVFRSEVTFVPRVNAEAQNITPALEWNQPPAKRRYIPFSPDQILIGQRNYAAPFGDGVALSYTFNHGLGTAALHVTVRQNVEGGERVPDNGYTLNYDGTNAVTVVFSDAPALNALVVLITTADFPATFQPHGHPIGEVDGLDLILAELGSRLTELEALVPSGSLTSSPKQELPAAQWVLPDIMELFPVPRSYELPGSVSNGLADLIKAAVPRVGGLLPAVHDAASEALPLPLATVPSEGLEGKVFQNTSGAVVQLPGGLGRKGVALKANEYCACVSEAPNRLSWYRVARAVGSETSWYPTDFDRELFMLSVNDKQLRYKKTLQVAFALELAIFASNTRAQYVVVIEWGKYADDLVPESAAKTFTADFATSVLTSVAHGLGNGTPLRLASSTALPAGLGAGNRYYVINAAADTFQVSLSLGGAAVDFADAGTGVHQAFAVTGLNLASITWQTATPILQQRVMLTSVPCTHVFGCRIKRELLGGVDTLSAVRVLYGGEEGGASAPDSANFALRARLIRFDTENSEADPRGLVGIAGLKRVAGAEESGQAGTAQII